MPGLAQRNDNQFSDAMTTSSLYPLSCSNGSVSANGFWSKHRDHISYNQLQKFWSELSPQVRQELLRIDKQTLFEQARKNMYCSRCNGLLLEGFLQIVMYGKSLQQEGTGGHLPCNRPGAPKNQNNGDLGMTTGCQDDVQDPSVHPWGGLITARDGTLTLLDCYLYSKSLKGLQNVFDSARARERERELLYPDACGGGGRGWISQGMTGYGRGHGTRETCALHTARLSVDTLVDFWSALGEETRLSLLRMKEEDFIERLMYRFDSKRFCRDCRRNVIREFKELKELKRMRREPRCTSWFCVADTAFQYEVSHDTVQADWHQTFTDTVGTYHHFEWAVGTGEGKSDILEFENVGMSGRVQVNGLDLGGLNACYITLRAWKMDGRCSELSVKAHALKGQQCVHCRLVVGDGFVTSTRGESIRRFFEHAEEAEEEEDDDSMDKDGNELDGECSRPQKHAKSPELAREFLLDAATVIFKEQVEKAFREGTARQNAHSIFVCLALKLLEERVHVACKEIITLEKQMKLLEEEEKEKREEEERKERRRTKEREKKLRRKERLRGKEKDREKKSSESSQIFLVPDVLKEESLPNIDEEPSVIGNRDLVSETGDAIPSRPLSADNQDEQFPNRFTNSNMQNLSDDGPDEEFANVKEVNGSFTTDHSKVSRRKLKFRKGFQLDSTLKWSDRRRFAVVSDSVGMVSRSEPRYHGDSFDISSRSINGLNKQLKSNVAKSNIRNGGLKFGEKFHCSNNRMNDRYDFLACSCNQHNDYRAKVEPHVSTTRVGWETKSVSKSESVSDMSKPYYRGNKYNQIEYMRESCGRPKSKIISGNNPSSRDVPHIKKVWEPMESQKKYSRSNSDSDVTLRSSTFKIEGIEADNLLKSSDGMCSDEVTRNLDEFSHEDNNIKEPRNFTPGMDRNWQNGFHVEAKASRYSKEAKEAVDEEVELFHITTSSLNGRTGPSMSSNSNSDNCSSCLSEGDSNTASSASPNPESLSTSDSEDASQHSEGRETSVCNQNGFLECHEFGTEKKESTDGGDAFKISASSGFSPASAESNFPGNLPTRTAQNPDNGKTNVSMGSQHQGMHPPMHNQSIHFPMFQAPSTIGYYHQSPVSWPAAPANGLMPFSHPNHYVFASPIGYGLNGNSRFVHYGALQHLTPPLLNPGQVPVYQPVPRANGMNSKEQTKICKAGGVQESHNEVNMERVVPTGQRSMEAQGNGEGGPNGNSDKSHMGNSSFSLFHYAGPVALSTGHKSNPVPSKEGIAGGLSSNISADLVEGDHACNKKDTIEEYNLFAASPGIRFPLF
uniref:Stress response protein NST1 n=1 Tax=Davidia involucrata TaxID=16924 RepID=A0A5B6ZQ85_DAVIN